MIEVIELLVWIILMSITHEIFSPILATLVALLATLRTLAEI